MDDVPKYTVSGTENHARGWSELDDAWELTWVTLAVSNDNELLMTM